MFKNLPFKINNNKTYKYEGKIYHTKQYIKTNPLWNETNPSLTKKTTPLYKCERKYIFPLYKNEEKNIYQSLPNKINAINHSLKAVDKKYKSHQKIDNPELYKKVLNFFFKRLVYYLIKTGTEIKIPYVKLGSLQFVQVKSKHTEKKVIDYQASLKKNKTVYKRSKFYVAGYMPVFRHYRNDILDDDIEIRTCNLTHADNYEWSINRTVLRPNTYNKFNHKLTLIDFFVEKGYKFYKKAENLKFRIYD